MADAYTMDAREISLKPYPITYRYHERMLAQASGREVRFPLRVFHLHGLGIDTRAFIRDLAPSFQDLPWDTYDMKREQLYFLHSAFPDAIARLQTFDDAYYSGQATLTEVSELIGALRPETRQAFHAIRPSRRRAVARFHLRKLGPCRWSLARVPAGGFSQTQGGNDPRAKRRVFAEMHTETAQHPAFQTFLIRLGEMVESIHQQPEQLDITAHQMGVVARHGKFGDNAPEGLHKDGTDYIVSALVVERKAVRGGVSTVYGDDQQTVYLSLTLRPGEGIFQADQESPFWHDVTPVYLDPQAHATEGQRNIFGFDIRVL
jgi:hypothetical protein